MLRSPLHDAHVALGAKMAPFAGWEMPISYTGTIGEHTSVRERAGLFDVSHLGKLLVAGADAARFLDRQLTNRMADLPPGRARYTLILDDDAGILDDLIVYAIAPGEMLVVPNAANADLVERRLAGAAPAGVTVTRLPWATIAVQGPAATGIVAARFPAAKELSVMHVVRDGEVLVARSGYTGERGFEAFAPAEAARDLWDQLLDAGRAAGGEPCGLAARDTLRLEMGYPLHGNDIDADTTPAEAGLMWAVKLEGRSFPGRDALARHQPNRALVGIRMLDRVIPRRGATVLLDGHGVGVCTSGTFSPTLKVGIALAMIDRAATDAAAVEVEVRGKRGRGRIVAPPFIDRSPR